MVIKRLNIRNFRGISNMAIDLDSHINLIVGINGAGKSSVLDAISLLLSWFIARMNNPRGYGSHIQPDDIKQNEGYCHIEMETENVPSWSLFRGVPYHKEKNLEHKTDLHNMMQLIHSIQEELNVRKMQTSIPVIAHYHVNRSVTEIPLRLHKQNKFNILDTYKGALDSKLEFRRFFEWYREREDLENEQYRYNNHQEDIQLKAVRKALSIFFPHYKNLRIQRSPRAMVIEKNEEKLKINQLSDGEKCYISLICDLSRRLAIANPTLENPLDGKGVVLIDEIELHLHPKWQMEIISKLKETFRNCQFIISTHSPQVLSDIQKEQLILIKDGEKFAPTFKTYGKLVNDILIDQFEIGNPRSQEVQARIDRAKKFLSNNQATEFNQEIIWLEENLGNDDLDIIALKIEAIRKQKNV